MTELLREHTVTCPSCWERNQVTLDLSVDEQEYVEDCQVCCSPMTIAVRSSEGEVTAVEVEPA